MSLAHYGTVAELIRARAPEHPVMAFLPAALRAEAERFVAGFPGAVHYAVKANPHPAVLAALMAAGIRGFDVASLAEMAAVRAVDPNAHLAYNHPAKTVADIERAWHDHGVRHFVVDHERELAKLARVCGKGGTVQVRIAKSNPDAQVDLNEKFGCDAETAARLMAAAAAAGFAVAAAMHVGWQARNPQAWPEAMALAAQAARVAGVRLAYANLGGGFPSVLMPHNRRLEDFFAVIAAARDELMPGTALNCEPGSALVWRGGVSLARVVLRKDDAVYLTDGIYGAMNELRFSAVAPPATAFRPGGEVIDGPAAPVTVYGPTCDSIDVLPARIALPVAVDEGDYVAFEWMGSYSNALRTDFNGLGRLDYVTLDAVT